MKKTILSILSLALVGALVLSSCTTAEPADTTSSGTTSSSSGTTTTTPADTGPEMARTVNGDLVEKPRYGGTVTVSTDANPSTVWDPWWQMHGGAGYLAMPAIYERFMSQSWAATPAQRPAGMWFIPMVAAKGTSMESYENPDPLTYIIHFREGQKFHDKPPVNGREVTAEDWKFSIDRQVGLGEWTELGVSGVGYSAWDVVESTEVLDRYTLEITLSEASAMFPEFWGAEIGPWVYPREVLDENGPEFGWEVAIGSGPWVLEDLLLDSSITYKKFDDYYGTDDNFPENHVPYADELKVLIIDDWTTRLAALRTGKIDHLGVGWEDGATLQETNPELQWAPDIGIAQGLAVNLGKEPYSDIRVRRAMQMAIPLVEIAESFYGGTADPYPFLINPAFQAYVTPQDELPEECAAAFQYDPVAAKALLAEAGYPNGFKQVLPQTNAWDLGDLLIAYLEEIGIETEINLMESAAYNAIVYAESAERDVAYWWAGAADWHPVQVLSYIAGGQETHYWNLADANDPYINDRRDAIMATTDEAEKDRMYKEAFLYGTCQFYQISGPAQINYTMFSPWLKGYWGQQAIVAVGWAPVFAYVWIDTDLKASME